MDEKDISSEPSAALRQRAEALFLERSPQNLETLTPEKVGQLLHELQVHQIELEMQNEELRRMQVEMDVSRARYFDLYDMAPVGYLTVSEEGRIIEANLTAAGLLGVSRSALVKQAFTRFIAQDAQDAFYLQSKQLQAMATPQTFELRLLGHERQPFWAHLSVSLATNANGAEETRIVLNDISTRKQAETALATERNLLHTLVDLLPTWVFVKDRESRFMMANQACAKNMGAASPEAMVGKTDADFFPSEVAARLRLEELGVLNGTPIVNQEITKTTPEGRQHILLVQKVPLRDPAGTINGLLGAISDITEIKVAEDELRANEAFQRDILNALPAHIAVLDSAGVIVAVNEPWLHYSQMHNNPKPDQINTGVSYFDVCRTACENGDTYASAAVAGIQSVLAGKQQHFSLDYPCDEPDRKRWFSMEVYQPRGSAFGAIVAHTDISERKRTEEALRDANQKLRLHFEQTPMGVIEWDLDFRVTQWNPAARTIFGYSREEALGQHASFIVPEPYRHLVNGVFQALLTRSGGEHSKNPNVSKDGTPILCDWFNTPLIDEHGTVRGVASVVMDITEQTESLQLLAWEKSALELIGSLTPLHEVLDGLMLSLEKRLPGALCSVLLLDEDGVHLRHGAAPSLPRTYNQAIDGLAIGPKVGSCGTAVYFDRQVIVEDIDNDPLWADYREFALSHDLHACWSTPIRCSKGKILATFAVYYHKAQQPVPHELELIDRATHIIRIAIERKRAEEEIRRLNADLERRVKDRTAELELVNKELESFSYSVSHDLRAPLRAVDGFSRMVISDYASKLDDEGQRMLGVVSSEAQRMGRLIDNLLEFSRLGRTPIQSVPIDMHTLAQEVFDELSSSDREQTPQLDLKPLPPAYGAEALIRQVWVNLISNALKFTNQRDPAEIEIGAKEDEQGGWIYYIKDNGAGFDMRYVDKLFGVFQRLHNQQEFSGTGVGLALVQRIVKRHGGRIWAESEVNKGATFYFTLPNQLS